MTNMRRESVTHAQMFAWIGLPADIAYRWLTNRISRIMVVGLIVAYKFFKSAKSCPAVGGTFILFIVCNSADSFVTSANFKIFIYNAVIRIIDENYD